MFSHRDCYWTVLFWGVDTQSVWMKGPKRQEKMLFWNCVDILLFVTSVASHWLFLSFVSIYIFVFWVSLCLFFSPPNTRASYREWQLITTPSPHPITSWECVYVSACARRKWQKAHGRAWRPFLCLFEHKSGCISWLSAFVVCLPCCYLCLYLHLHML